MRVLVTGGNGFIGRYVVGNLLERGHEVMVLDRTCRHINAASVVAFGDVRDTVLVNDSVYHVDGVIHLAAILGTQETVKAPAVAAETNIFGTLKVFDACLMYDKPCVYISVGNHWMNNPYSISKSAAERFAFMYNKEHGTRFSVVRGLNVYGPHQKAWPVRKVVPTFVNQALENEPITIYGDGEQIMDMIYVTDMAEVLVEALEQDHGVYDQAIEAGMGADTTVNHLAELIVRIAQSQSEIRHTEMRPGETAGAVVKADTTLLGKLGMSALAFVPLETGLQKTIEWYRSHD